MNRVEPPKSATRRVKLGGWLAIPEPLVVEAAGRAGYDWIGLDLQHGAWDLGTAFRAIQLLDVLGKPVLVRIAEEELPLIPRVLDHGAAGIVLAMASGPEMVAAAIERARYQPAGRRSYGGQRYGMKAEPRNVADLRPAIYPMIETRQAVERVRQIAAVPGVAGLHIGPTDLSLGLGLGTDRTPPVFDDAVKDVVAAGREAGVPVAMHAVHRDALAGMLAFGFDELVLTTDIELLRGAMADQVGNALAVMNEADSIAPAPGPYGRPS
jgi:4-hydroxy-2-oxoheptanedioate aldolase